MSDMNILDINGTDYEAIISSIAELTQEKFQFLNIIDDIANHILLKLFKFSAPAKPDFTS